MSEIDYRNTSGNTRQEATMRDILTPLFRRRRLLILTFCGVFLGAIAAAFSCRASTRPPWRSSSIATGWTPS